MRQDLLQAIRQRKWLGKDDTSRDAEIHGMSPENKLRALCGWHLGDPGRALTFLDWAHECGFTIGVDKI